MDTKFTKEDISNACANVHTILGFKIWNDIQSIKQKIIDSNKILKKMETMADSLLEKVIKTDLEFMEMYNSNPSLYKQIIIDEYVREYKEKFHILYDFHIELNQHKMNLNVLLNRAKNKKNKTEQDINYINMLKEYITLVSDKTLIHI